MAMEGDPIHWIETAGIYMPVLSKLRTFVALFSNALNELKHREVVIFLLVTNRKPSIYSYLDY